MGSASVSFDSEESRDRALKTMKNGYRFRNCSWSFYVHKIRIFAYVGNVDRRVIRDNQQLKDVFNKRMGGGCVYASFAKASKSPIGHAQVRFDSKETYQNALELMNGYLPKGSNSKFVVAEWKKGAQSDYPEENSPKIFSEERKPQSIQNSEESKPKTPMKAISITEEKKPKKKPQENKFIDIHEIYPPGILDTVIIDYNGIAIDCNCKGINREGRVINFQGLSNNVEEAKKKNKQNIESSSSIKPRRHKPFLLGKKKFISNE